MELPTTDDELSQRLRAAWPMMTWRDIGDIPRTVVVLHSVAVYLPPSWQPLLPAYEERFLCYLLGLASRGTHVVYVTSMPILPRLVDYWFSLVPGLDTPEVRARLTLVPVVDARSIPLTRKVLHHPGTVRRISEAVADPRWAVIMGHMVTEDDLELARLLGVPVYGPAPVTARWGTKSGSREAFRRSGLAVIPGLPVRTRADVAHAAARLHDEVAGLRRVIVKLDEGVSGVGNGTVTLVPGVPIEECVAQVRLEDAGIGAEEYYAHLEREGGVVEAFLERDVVRSPSVQLRTSPLGEVEVLSTHEQLLGGPHGLSYEGCTMPASGDYAASIAADAARVAALLADEGVVGRFAIDFLALRDPAGWTTYPLEINLRAGGTTHPLSTMTALCGGSYDVARAEYVADTGEVRCYRATDHLVDERFARLTTDDLLDVVSEPGLEWDPVTRTGVVLHMASAIGAMGAIGLTAVAETPAGADAAFERVRAVLLATAGE